MYQNVKIFNVLIDNNEDFLICQEIAIYSSEVSILYNANINASN
jgi:hypothetical protein